MKLNVPAVRGVMERRILVNFRVAPRVLAALVPPPFRLKPIRGRGMAGICLIRLKNIRPRFAPAAFGVTSENAAHRIAVEWDRAGEVRTGVFIPRRDTSSTLQTRIGGKIFPGMHHPARFDVEERDDFLRVEMRANDGGARVAVEARIADRLPATSVFASLAEASAFFEQGSLGYSVTPRPGEFEGLELRSFRWEVTPLAVARVESSFFADVKLFPPGAVEFDCALLMRGIEHEWHAREIVRADPGGSL